MACSDIDKIEEATQGLLSNPEIKAVIFDLDNTLIETQKVDQLCVEKVRIYFYLT